MKLILLLLLTILLFITLLEKRNVAALNPTGRIIGGQAAYVGQFKFAAAIEVTTKTSKYFCGGSLIHHQWILTAGQCVHDGILFTIHLGSITLEGSDSARLTLATSEYVLHPEYNPNTLENDVGLIQLRRPVSFTAYVQPIATIADLEDYTDLVIIGWGQTSDSQAALSNVLNFVNVTSVSNLECKAVYGNQINDDMVCVAGQYNEGTCIGDSGGALVHYAPNSRRHVGIASFISSNGCESLDPSGFARTYSYKEWIKNVTGLSL
jgi:secreted trypsin-like serine protease